MPVKIKPTLDIMVLNYNGWDLLKECLPSVIEDAERYPGNARVYVLDNASTDSSIENLKLHFPKVGVIVNNKNEYMFAYNKAIKNSQAQYVMVLNNDIKLNRGCIENLMVHFEGNNNVFAVQPLFLDWDGKGINGGQRYCKIRPAQGFFEFGTKYNVSKAEYTLSASGSCIYDRVKFIQLDGYDELFYPAYYEDSDLCWRAWTFGWPSIFEPGSTALHKGNATLTSVMAGDTNRLILLKTNQLVFMWRHMKGFKFWVLHLLLLAPRIIYWDLLYRRLIWLNALINALVKVKPIHARLVNDSVKVKAEIVINKSEILLNNSNVKPYRF